MILVLGPYGTLGQAVVNELVAVNAEYLVCSARTHIWGDMKRNLSQLPGGTVIINCAGDIHRDPVDEDRMYASNVIGPRIVAELAELYGHIVIHVSTDCVFHGRALKIHKVRDRTNPVDFYGYTKALGEVVSRNVINVRTSFIAPNQGLWAYALSDAPLTGWAVQWSGGTVNQVAEGLVDLAQCAENEQRPEDIASVRKTKLRKLVVHMATPYPVEKGDLLRVLAPHKPIRMEPFPNYSRALKPTYVLLPLTAELLQEASGG